MYDLPINLGEFAAKTSPEQVGKSTPMQMHD